MIRLIRYVSLIIAALLYYETGSAWLRGAESSESVAFFESRIRPVLIDHCYECHGPDVAEPKGGLRLDRPSRLRHGGESGPAIIAGDPEGSLILQALRYEGFEMPPSGRLADTVVEDFARWIREGAIDPRAEEGDDEPTPSIPTEIDLEAGRQFWAFQPIRPVAPSPVRDRAWPSDPIDQWVLHRLEQAGLSPVGEAEPRTALRRLAFDLTGLPPTPEVVAKFTRNPSQPVWEQIVDQFLASPEFGVHWGRHWLDVARYADSNGNDFNATFHDAWRYRDYVIDSFNTDRPFDQFVVEQIAGDLLPYDSDEQRARQLIATGFLMVGSKMLSERDKAQLTMDVVDEQVSAVGQVFLGMTLNCARCHDHKFDPIPTEDYYALAGIFRSTLTLQGESQQYVSTWPRHPLPTSSEHVTQVREYERQQGQLKAQIKETRQLVAELTKSTDKSAELAEVKHKLQQAELELKELEATAPTPLPTAFAVIDQENIGDCSICIRGEHTNVGPPVPRGVVRVAAWGDFPPIQVDQSGRRELAEWIVSERNPLTARVIVNRIWHYLFGEGLVRSVDNFGALGDRPTHPELLDELASQFVRDEWSVKRLVRRMVLSRTYRLSSQYDETRWQRDPENQLLWRANRKRMSAESMRDAMVLASGRLLAGSSGSPVSGFGTLVTINSADQEKPQQQETLYRGAYLPILRGELPTILTTFDFADPDLVVGRRNATNVPAQALFLLNSPFVADCANGAARSIDSQQTVADQIAAAYELVLGRPPALPELTRGIAFMEAVSQERDTSGDSTNASSLAQLIHMLFASVEFRMLD